MSKKLSMQERLEMAVKTDKKKGKRAKAKTKKKDDLKSVSSEIESPENQTKFGDAPMSLPEESIDGVAKERIEVDGVNDANSVGSNSSSKEGAKEKSGHEVSKLKIDTEDFGDGTKDIAIADKESRSEAPKLDTDEGSKGQDRYEANPEEKHEIVAQPATKSDNESLLKKIARLEQENATLLSQLKIAAAPVSAQLAEKDEQIKQLLEEGHQLSMKELKYTTMIKNLRAKDLERSTTIEDLTLRTTETEKKLSEVNELFINLSQKDRENQAKIERLEAIEADYNSLSEHHKKIQAELSEYKFKKYEKKLADEIKKTTELTSTLEKERIQLSLAKSSSLKEISDLRAEIEDLKNRNKSLKEEYTFEISRLEGQIEALRFSNENFKTKQSSGSASLETEIQSLRLKYELAMENLRNRETEHSAKINQMNEILEKYKKNEHLESIKAKKSLEQYSILKEEYSNAMESYTKAQISLEELKNELKAQTEKTQAVSQKYEELLNKYSTAIPSLEKKITDLESTSVKLPIASFEKGLNHSSSLLLLDPNEEDQSRGDYFSPSVGWRSPDLTGSAAIMRSVSSQLQIPHRRLTSNGNLMNIGNDTELFNFDSLSKFELVLNQALPFLPQAGGFNQGPSIQLISKLSSKILRLETELGTVKEESKKAGREKNELRAEIARLMGKVEELEVYEEKNKELESEITSLREREKVSLELLGEKSELVEELRNDVLDLKEMLREQVEEMVKMK